MRNHLLRGLGRWSAVNAGLLGTFAGLGYAQSVLTWHNDNLRTGQNLAETVLTPANVKSATFQKLLNLPVDGKVDAQPLYVSGLAIAGGTHNGTKVQVWNCNGWDNQKWRR